MMRRSLLVTVLLAAAFGPGCAKPVPPPPAPQQLTVSKAPTDVVRIAAATLAAEGYEAVTSDADAGVLVMRRVRHGPGAMRGQACRWPENSVGARDLRATHTITVTARATTDGGSAVVVAGHTLSEYPAQTALPLPPSETDCVSDGTMEAAVLAALGVEQ